ncbi:MAG: thiamine pyrophosphate-dependent enzyme, partial [Pseudoxanthomonas sp.]
MTAKAIPARMKGLNRAEICDQNFIEFVREWNGMAGARPAPDEPVIEGSALKAQSFVELLESQLVSRHLDLMARVLRVQNKVFYTIGSSGHEGNAMVARLTRHTDPAFLHYRSGAFMAERFRKLPGTDGKPRDPIMDSALSFAASSEDPASGGRHKVWGSKPLWVLPQTSTIASHLPKALGTAVAIEQARRIGHASPIPEDSIAICSFGDASSNHATAQTAFNAAAWTSYQKLPAPVLFVCEDNGIGISVKTPGGWIERNFSRREDLDYFYADGLDLATGYGQVQAAVEHCRRSRRPTFLHLRTTRIMGHAGTDFEIEWRPIEELVAVEAGDPLLRSAAIALESGLYSKDSLLALYEQIRVKCFAAADAADRTPKLTRLDDVIAPLAPYSPEKVMAEATRIGNEDKRLQV